MLSNLVFFQIDVTDESTFENVIIEFMKQNDIDVENRSKYQLVDTTLNIINCPHSYVRDFYNKSSIPEVK